MNRATDDLISRASFRSNIQTVLNDTTCPIHIAAEIEYYLELEPAVDATPVRPIIKKNISTGECEDPWGRLFFCSACGKRINEKYNPDEDDKYCKHCGQAVKWDT